METSEEKQTHAGRGGLAVLAAKVFFIVVGFVQQPLLKAAIGLDGYGALSRVLSVSNVVNNVVVSGSTQGVSRLVAQAKNDRIALRQALGVHLPLAIVLGLVLAVVAPFLASFQHAPHIRLPLIVMAVVLIAYGCYAPLIGALNGRGQFVRQASLDIMFATLRTVLMVGCGVLLATRGAGPLGTTIGFAIAACFIVPLALRWTGTGEAGVDSSLPSAKTYLVQWLTIASAQLGINLLMQMDLFLLGRCLSLRAADLSLIDASKRADEWVGTYKACQLFAFLPYQLLFSVTQVLFPMLARARANTDGQEVKTLVVRGTRIGLILVGLIVSIVITLPGSLLNFAYGAVVADGGESTLRVLALGMTAFALLGLAMTILTSLGREGLASVLTWVSAVLVGLLVNFLTRNADFGRSQLLLSSMATSSVLLLVFVVASTAVWKTVGAFLPLLTFARVGATVALFAGAGFFLPRLPKLLVPFGAVAVVLAYIASLIVTRELTGADLAQARAVVQRRRAK